MFHLLFVAILLVSNCCVESTKLDKRNVKSLTNEDKLSRTIHQLLSTLQDNDSASFQFNHKLITISSESKDSLIKELKKHQSEKKKPHEQDGNENEEINPENMNEEEFLNYLTKFEKKPKSNHLESKQKLELTATSPRPHPTQYHRQKMLQKNMKSAEYNNNYNDMHVQFKSRQNYNQISEIAREPHTKKENYEKKIEKRVKYVDYNNYNRLNSPDNNKDNYDDITIAPTEPMSRTVDYNQKMLQKSLKYPEFNEYDKITPKETKGNEYNKFAELSRENPSGNYYNQKIIQRNLQSELVKDYDRFNPENNNKDNIPEVSEAPIKKEHFQQSVQSNVDTPELNEYNGMSPLETNTNYYNQITETTPQPLFNNEMLQKNTAKLPKLNNYITSNPLNGDRNKYNQNMYYYNTMSPYGQFPRAKREIIITKQSPDSVDVDKIEDIVAKTIFNESTVLLFDYNEAFDDIDLSDNKNECPKLKRGEKEIDINAAPYHVAYGRKCDGAIIHKKWVLTAAHCKKHVHILFGDGDFENSQPMKIRKHYVHPNWKRDHKQHPYDYNFQLLELKEDLPFSSAPELSQAIRIRTENLEVGKNVSVIGWAVMRDGEKYPYMLREFSAPVVDNKFCNNKNDLEYHGDLTDTMFCVGYEEGDKCGCQDDSGSPAVVNGQLVGLVSFGRRCSTANSYGVYSNVSSVIRWIKETIGETLF